MLAKAVGHLLDLIQQYTADVIRFGYVDLQCSLMPDTLDLTVANYRTVIQVVSQIQISLGITAKAVKSRVMKDMGSPLKPLDDKDLAVIQGMVDEYHKRFVDVVAAGRPGIKRDELLSLANGRVYSAAQAKANGLVDELGYVADAVAMAKARAGVTLAKVVMYNRPLGYRSKFYSAAGLPAILMPCAVC